MTEVGKTPKRLLDPLRKLANLFGVSHAILYSLMTRGWQVLAGPVTIILIAQFYSVDEQGFYYAFASILAMQSFFELGFFNVIVTVTAHEWAQLSWSEGNRVEGDSRAHSRLRSLARFNLVWYGFVTTLYLVLVSMIGWWILAQKGGTEIEWQRPWIAAVAVAGLQLICLPFNGMLEGCNRVNEINLLRLAQASLGAIPLWITIASGGGLWAPVAAGVTALLCNLVFFAGWFGEFFRDLFKRVEGPRISWRKELWPLQFRIGIDASLNWFRFYLFTPVLFYYAGPVIAGQFGMTWQIVGVVESAAFAWVQTRIPEMGRLVAQRRFAELDKLFKRSGSMTLMISVTGAVGVLLLVWGLGALLPQYAARLLPVWQVGLFLAGMIGQQIVRNAVVYVRAHKIEPFVLMSVSVSLLQGALVWQLGKSYGSPGQGIALVGVVFLLAVPWSLFILRQTRREEQTRRP